MIEERRTRSPKTQKDYCKADLNDRILILEFALLNRGVPSPRKLANAYDLEKCLLIRVGFTGSSSSIAIACVAGAWK